MVHSSKHRRTNYAKSKKGKNPLQISGKTIDNKSVVRGVFSLFSSYTGLPLQDIIEILYQNDMIVDWIDFYESSLKGGWRSDRTLVKIRDAVGDVFGPVTGEKIIERLKFYLKPRS